MRLVLAAILMLLALPALAQQPNASDKLLMSSLQMQQVGVDLQKAAVEMQAMQRRIAELEALCGDPCKPKKGE